MCFKAFLLSLLYLGLVAGLYLFNITINLTSSMPRGFYVKSHKEKIGVNDYVSFCPKNDKNFLLAKERGYFTSGSCSLDIQPLIKKVVGVGGSRVVVKRRGVFINGRRVKDSTPLRRDGRNNHLEIARDRRLKTGEFWLMSEHKRGFDSRYFGSISSSEVLSTLKPLCILN
jgi:conjugative transfer signal peptidase TraF